MILDTEAINGIPNKKEKIRTITRVFSAKYTLADMLSTNINETTSKLERDGYYYDQCDTKCNDGWITVTIIYRYRL